MNILPCPNPACDPEGDLPLMADHDVLGNVTTFRFVECHGCGMCGPRCATKREAAAAWNSLPRNPETSHV